VKVVLEALEMEDLGGHRGKAIEGEGGGRGYESLEEGGGRVVGACKVREDATRRVQGKVVSTASLPRPEILPDAVLQSILAPKVVASYSCRTDPYAPPLYRSIPDRDSLSPA
jgi:hypothetical protein